MMKKTKNQSKIKCPDERQQITKVKMKTKNKMKKKTG